MAVWIAILFAVTALAQAPVTCPPAALSFAQVLELVAGHVPESRIQGADRPVERVSLDDAQRGGAFLYVPLFAQPPYRYRNTPCYRFFYSGFRLV